MKADVLCVGNVVLDAVGVPIDGWPNEGSLRLFDRVEMHIGGCAANTASALAKLGIRCSLLSKISDDELGELIERRLRRDGIDTRGLRVAKGAAKRGLPSPFSFIMVPSSGNRRIYHTRGISTTFGPRDVDRRLFKGPRWVAFQGLSVMPHLAGKNLAGLLKAAKRAGARTIGDTALNHNIEDWNPMFEGCWPHFDVFFPSEEEAFHIAGPGKSPREICRYFLDRGVKIAGVKLGERGCAVMTGERYEEFPVFPVRCVDALGAGDSFIAGFLAGMLKKDDPFAAARMASAVGAHCVQAVGATTGIPKLAKVEAFLRRH